MDLASMHCTPVQDRPQPLTRGEIAALRDEVPEWRLREGALVRQFVRGNFPECLEFIGVIAALAETEGHYPDLCIRETRYVELMLYSHHAGGLTLNDFILAAKITALEFSRRVDSLSG
jgi:4a-hydroxytetrahydrobiopterin dehydratase